MLCGKWDKEDVAIFCYTEIHGENEIHRGFYKLSIEWEKLRGVALG